MDALAANAYLLLTFGAFVEGDLSVIAGGVLAQQGRLALLAVMLIASSVAWASDLSCFWVGRAKGGRALGRLPRLGGRIERLHGWVERYPSLAVFTCRFTYGMRIAGPLLIGTSRMQPWKFAALSALGCVAWGVLMTSLGWAFGSGARALFEAFGWALLLVLPAAVAGIGLVVWMMRRRRTVVPAAVVR